MCFKRLFCVLVALLSVALPGVAQSPGNFGKQSLVFEPNRGQAPSDTTFVSHSNGHSVFLKRTEAVLAFANPATNVRMKLVGQNPHPAIEGADPLAAVSNYLIGNNPQEWDR